MSPESRTRRPIPLVAFPSLVIALFGVSLLSTPSGADGAISASDRRQQVSALSASLVSSGRRLAALERSAARAAGREAELSARLDRAERSLAASRRREESARSSAIRAGRALGRARERLARTVVGIYMGGQSDMAGLALAGEDFGELVAGQAYFDAIADAGGQAAERVAALREQRMRALGEAEDASRRAESLLAGISRAREMAVAIRAAISTTAAGLADLRASRRSRIDRLREEIEAAEAQVASSGGSGGATYPGGPYSIPTYIVMCESGGNYSAVNPSSGAGGAYQIMPSTWAAYGGEGLPQNASKAEQDRIAAIIWANDGPGAWTCS